MRFGSDADARRRLTTTLRKSPAPEGRSLFPENSAAYPPESSTHAQTRFAREGLVSAS